mmetsp:Transcript_33863/g.80659  ORF Transcript_33863/g.80659 Transcript_33863/m.80659 type:complete len:312 (+) Transcript_33863:1-936(+)
MIFFSLLYLELGSQNNASWSLNRHVTGICYGHVPVSAAVTSHLICPITVSGSRCPSLSLSSALLAPSAFDLHCVPLRRRLCPLPRRPIALLAFFPSFLTLPVHLLPLLLELAVHVLDHPLQELVLGGGVGEEVDVEAREHAQRDPPPARNRVLPVLLFDIVLWVGLLAHGVEARLDLLGHVILVGLGAAHFENVPCGARLRDERVLHLWGEEAALPGDSSCVDLLALVSDLEEGAVLVVGPGAGEVEALLLLPAAPVALPLEHPPQCRHKLRALRRDSLKQPENPLLVLGEVIAVLFGEFDGLWRMHRGVQ